MVLPICLEIPEIPDPFAITLPGGVTIEQINLAQAIQPALTPLVPFFDVIDAIVAVFNCVKAIPDTLGPPPDPTALAVCIPELGEKVAKLLRLLPQLSLPTRWWACWGCSSTPCSRRETSSRISRPKRGSSSAPSTGRRTSTTTA